MVRNLLSGIAGGAGLIVAAVGLADGVKWPLIGVGALLIAASVIGFLSDWLRSEPPSIPPPRIGIQAESGGIVIGNAVTGYDVGIQAGPDSATIGNALDGTSTPSQPSKKTNWLVRMWRRLFGPR